MGSSIISSLINDVIGICQDSVIVAGGRLHMVCARSISKWHATGVAARLAETLTRCSEAFAATPAVQRDKRYGMVMPGSPWAVYAFRPVPRVSVVRA